MKLDNVLYREGSGRCPEWGLADLDLLEQTGGTPMVTPPLGMLGHSALSGAFRSVYNISGRLKARQKLAGTEDLSSLVLMYAQFDPSVKGHGFAKKLALSWRHVETVFSDSDSKKDLSLIHI